MNIQFWGGARTVTGSKHLLTSGKQRLLLECGLFQGHRAEAEHTNRNLPFKAREVNWGVISHAHIDHVGNIPNLVKYGFRGWRAPFSQECITQPGQCESHRHSGQPRELVRKYCNQDERQRA